MEPPDHRHQVGFFIYLIINLCSIENKRTRQWYVVALCTMKLFGLIASKLQLRCPSLYNVCFSVRFTVW